MKRHSDIWFLCAVLAFIALYSLSTLTTKPAYWYDEAINVELARNFADFGRLDLVVAPNTFSGKGATVGSTGYPVTLPLAGFFKLFGFGLEQARVYMLLWMSACIVAFFLVARKLWGPQVAYFGTLLIVTLAPFYGNGRSVMGEIPGFLFFLCSFYFLEKKKFLLSGVLLGLSVISKPSVFVFLIPAYALAVLYSDGAWKARFLTLLTLGASSVLAFVPWFFIYTGEIVRGGLGENIFNHFKNPYQEAGVSALANISHNLGTFFQSTTLLYFTALLVLVIVALYLNRGLFRNHRMTFLLSAAYIPLALLQYLKSFGYLRYLIAAELLVFVLFILSLPVLVRFVIHFFRHPLISEDSGELDSSAAADGNDAIDFFAKIALCAMVIVQVIHLFWFSDIYPGEKTQKTLSYLSFMYPEGTIGIMNLPQVGSMVAPDRKYQYLSTFGLWQFGTNPLLLPEALLPAVVVIDSEDSLPFSEKGAFSVKYEEATAFSDGFLVYRKRE